MRSISSLACNTSWRSGFKSRLEAFYKPVSQPALRFENLWSPDFLFDQLEIDRFGIQPDSSTVQGIELSLQGPQNGPANWALSYTWSEGWDMINGEKHYRRFDQRHTVNLNLGAHLGRRWYGHLVWHFHSGWRTTDIRLLNASEPFDLELGTFNGKKLPSQHRLDLRFSRDSNQGKGFGWHIDIINLYNRENIRGYDEIFINEASELTFVPSTGLSFAYLFRG